MAVLVAGAGLAAFIVYEPLRRRSRPAPPIDPAKQPTPLADVTAGASVLTAGLVVGPTDHAPLDGPACAFHRIEIERVDPPETIYSARSSEELVLGDGSGKTIRVPLEDAVWLDPPREVIVSAPGARDARLDAFLASRGLDASGAVRARVHWIGAHELVFARGAAGANAPASDDYRTNERVDMELVGVRIGLEPI